MKRHRVKSWPEFYAPIRECKRMFDLRVNDKHYAVGDQITFCEFDPDTGKPTGNETVRRITGLIEGVGPGAVPPLRGLHRGYCILALDVPGE